MTDGDEKAKLIRCNGGHRIKGRNRPTLYNKYFLVSDTPLNILWAAEMFFNAPTPSGQTNRLRVSQSWSCLPLSLKLHLNCSALRLGINSYFFLGDLFFDQLI